MDIANATLRVGNYLNVLDFPPDAAPRLKSSSIGWFCKIPELVDRVHQQLDTLVEERFVDFQTSINTLVPRLLTTEDEELKRALFYLHNVTSNYPINGTELMGLVALDYFNRYYQRSIRN
ncbi:hypothetical protein COY27_06460 [Candidatus Woesearchaeota archaeon CG_4_10_14_0_2_um_filter_33_13]|nr:MAG: hypothetical protein COY27_06460 [Candidatus Woesearchaeota archaeon CG_4_10_14_0_2_um_filter_33_13]